MNSTATGYTFAEAGALIDALITEHPEVFAGLDERRFATAWSRMCDSDIPALVFIISGEVPAGIPETFRGYPVVVLTVSLPDLGPLW